MPALFSNNATTTLSSGITSGATTMSVAASTGALFPALSGSDYYYATLIDASNNREIVKVTARVGDTMTMTRAQEGTTARAFSAGHKVELRPTAASLNNFLSKEGGVVSGAVTFNGSATFGGAFTLPTAITLASGTTTFSTGTANFAVGLQVAGAPVVSTTATQTLTNKTLTAPTIATIVNTGTLTLPTATTTLVGRDTTDTLTNKTVTGLATTSTIKDTSGTAYTIGYRGAPLQSKTSAYTFALGDEGTTVSNTTGGWIIPANSAVAFATDTILTGYNASDTAQSLSIAAPDVLRLNGTTTTGTRSVPPRGLFGVRKVGATEWVAWGVS